MSSTPARIDEIRLLDRRQVAEALGRSPDTLDFWVRQGKFPTPIQAYPGAKKQWRLAVVKAWLTKRERARYRPPTPRGRLKQEQAAD